MTKERSLLILMSMLFGCAQAQVQATASGDSALQAFLPQWERAQSRFINGGPTRWKENASHRDDATVFGAFGGHEKGWNEVGPRYDWASSQFQESGAKQEIEYLNTGVSGDIAFTVSIERQEARVGDQRALTSRALRVTSIFRKEDGAWKLLHRHADPLTQRQAPPATPQR